MKNLLKGISALLICGVCVFATCNTAEAADNSATDILTQSLQSFGHRRPPTPPPYPPPPPPPPPPHHHGPHHHGPHHHEPYPPPPPPPPPPPHRGW